MTPPDVSDQVRRASVALAAVACQLLAPGALPAQTEGPDKALPGPFERLSSAHGLSSNSVYTILEDRRGFLWFGTVDGLNRYDGYQFIVYRTRPDDSASLSSNGINALLEDRAGRLWVGTDRGLDRMRPDGRSFDRFSIPGAPEGGDPEYEVRDLALDRAGTVWAATSSGLLRHDEAGDRLEVFRDGSLAGQPATTLAPEPGGGLWVLVEPPGGRGRLVRLGPDGGVAEDLRLSPGTGEVHDLLVDRRGRVWLSHAAPLVLEDGVASPPAGAGPALAPRHIVEDDDGTVWIGSASGLHRVSPDGAVAALRPDTGESTWLHNYVRALAFDRSGALWLGTYAGLYRHDPAAKRFRVLRHRPDDPASLSASAVSDLLEGDEGALWVATYGGGLNRLSPDGAATALRHRPDDPNSIPDDLVWVLHRGPLGGLWVGTHRGLARVDPATGDVRRVDSRRGSAGASPPPTVTSLATGPGGRIWAGGFEGLRVVDPSTGAATPWTPFVEARPPGRRTVDWITTDDERGVLWLGLPPGEIGRVDPAAGRFDVSPLSTPDGRPLPSEGVWQILLDGEGGLWVAHGAGLSHVDPETGRQSHYGVAEGLPGSVVFSLVEDAAGGLWMGTNKGIAHFDPSAPPERAFRAYGPEDGVGGSEFNRHAVLATEGGELLFGGVDGLTRFHPDEIRRNPYVPPVVLTRVEVATRGDTSRVEPADVGHLVLSPSEHTFSVEYAALSFTNPVGNRYAYRLDGFDGGWIDAGGRRFARYTRVPPGDYVFRVRGSNEDGVWNEEGATLTVTVLPPFWGTLWFQGMAAALLVASLVVAHRVRVARLLELERMRLRIARDLHDDLGSDLSAIALATDVVRSRAALDPDQARRLAEVRDTALEKVEALRDIVWYIDPEHDTLEATLRRMRAFGERILTGLEHRFEVVGPVEGRPIPMALRRNLMLFHKEVLHNARRHAGAGRVDVRVDVGDHRVALEVADDGRGFTPGAGSGRGLANLRARAREMGGTVEVESAPGAGTRVRLDVALARSRDGGGARRGRG